MTTKEELKPAIFKEYGSRVAVRLKDGLFSLEGPNLYHGLSATELSFTRQDVLVLKRLLNQALAYELVESKRRKPK